MNNLKKHQDKIFTKDNLPDLLEYLADYMREYPDCEKGFGLQCEGGLSGWRDSKSTFSQILSMAENHEWSYRIAPLTKTMYNIHTGEAVEVPLDVVKVFNESIYTIIMERKFDEYREKILNK